MFKANVLEKDKYSGPMFNLKIYLVVNTSDIAHAGDFSNFETCPKLPKLPQT